MAALIDIHHSRTQRESKEEEDDEEEDDDDEPVRVGIKTRLLYFPPCH